MVLNENSERECRAREVWKMTNILFKKGVYSKRSEAIESHYNENVKYIARMNVRSDTLKLKNRKFGSKVRESQDFY